jgi:hypothetical protein
MKPTSVRADVVHCRADPCGGGRLRSILFGIGDCLFLIFVGAVTTGAMQLLHKLGWNFAVTCFAGMLLAMIVQVLLALSVAPLLGSVEAMVPSMVLAMVSPMSVCALPLGGCDLNWALCAALGAAFGVAMFFFVHLHGFACRRSLGRAFQDRRAV